MKFLIVLAFYISTSTIVCAQKQQLGLAMGYGSTGTYLSCHLHISRLLNLPEMKSSTEIFFDWSGKKLEFNYQPPTFGFTGYEMVGINYPGTVVLSSFFFGVEEKFMIGGRHFISVVAGASRYKLILDNSIQDYITSHGVDRYYWVYDDISITTDYTKLGPTVYSGNTSLWNFAGGIGAGELFGKHFQANARLCLTPAQFDSGSTLFGKYFGAESFNNVYRIKLTVFAQIGVQYSFSVFKRR